MVKIKNHETFSTASWTFFMLLLELHGNLVNTCWNFENFKITTFVVSITDCISTLLMLNGRKDKM